MKGLYSSPIRVYLCFAVLAFTGIFLSTKLPVSLFPNSSKPKVNINISYPQMTALDFLNTYGKNLEGQIANISTPSVEVDRIEADYNAKNARFFVEFAWGNTPNEARREVESVVNSYAARFPKEIRDSIGIWSWSENGGFIAVSFYSKTRSLDEIYKIIDPILKPMLLGIKDAENPSLFNPNEKEFRVTLRPDAIASLQLFPSDIKTAVAASVSGMGGGSLPVGLKKFTIEVPPSATTMEEISQIRIRTRSGQEVFLSDIANIEYARKADVRRVFKTNSAPSLMLFASPTPGGNVKRMAEDIIQGVERLAPQFPKDVEYRVLVDPSEFIRSAVNNVMHEVVLAALLAVTVLFIFIGSVRNVVTAAIEIPLSMVLAFILMKMSGMNLNLISLGGLALAAGMNVDASVVVMENIFRHMDEMKGKALSFADKFKLVLRAVNEVKFAIIASTISSLVVFVPLAFTSELTFAILGDLAKTVVFSHGFSAVVALILVPTIRLQLMTSLKQEKPFKSPIHKQLNWLENLYVKTLGRILESRKLKWGGIATVTGILALMLVLLLPMLPKEIIGKPDTDWIILNVGTQGNSKIRQMETQAAEVESRMLREFGDKIQYTFNSIRGANRANVMARLKNKSDMMVVWKGLEKSFKNTPFLRFRVFPWNPSELPIPNPKDFAASVRGGDMTTRKIVARDLYQFMEAQQLFSRNWTYPSSSEQEMISLKPMMAQWNELKKDRNAPSLIDVASLVRVATEGYRVAQIPVDGRMVDVNLSYPTDWVTSEQDLSSFPIRVGEKYVPLRALLNLERDSAPGRIFRDNQEEVFYVYGKQNEEYKHLGPSAREEAVKRVENWNAEREKTRAEAVSAPVVTIEDSQKELNEALEQLLIAIGLSVLLILFTLMFQFGNFVQPLLVLVSVPLGFIGVLMSLYIFGSTLSLNSALGIILLNGIAVANSIIIVDFMRKLVARGRNPREAALEAAQKRLRPILMTSLTTILGMLPIALGLGEGGKILQPLGIAVSGGLWISTVLTLFVVPALQVSYLETTAGKGKSMVDPVREMQLKAALENFHREELLEESVSTDASSSSPEADASTKKKPSEPIQPEFHS